MTAGALHVRQLADGETTLLCLHPAPFDGSYFEPLAAELDGLNVLAPDYPGYGLSPALSQRPSIADYADAVAKALPDNASAALGFHTGCLVAAELSLRYPRRISGLILIDIPYFLGEEQQQRYADNVTDNRDTDGFRAAFGYDCGRLAGLTTPTLVIATGGNLREPTSAAAAVIPGARFEDRPAITRPAMKKGAVEFAALIRAFLHG